MMPRPSAECTLSAINIMEVLSYLPSPVLGCGRGGTLMLMKIEKIIILMQCSRLKQT